MHTYLGLAQLLRRTLAGEDLRPLGQMLLQCARTDPQDSAALLDAAILFEFQEQPALAAALRREALALSRHYRLPARHQPARVRVLALMAPGPIMANVPIECLLDNSDIDLELYYVRSQLPATVPAHDVLFVAIGESDTNRPLLEAWAEPLRQWPRPVLNHPRRILEVARDRAAQRLHSQPGLLMPPTWRVERGQLEAWASGSGVELADLGAGPWLVRPVDSHAGRGLQRVATRTALRDVLAQQTSCDYFISPFVDYRNADGRYRKYRVVLIHGEPFASHMAISEHWMIHYLNAGMDNDAAKRAEEAAWMMNFAADFAPRHAAAFAAIQAAFELEYLGIDCAELPDGRLLIFEVDPAMVVHDMDPIERYPYKPAAMQRVFAAFRGLLLARRGLSE